MNCNRAFEVQDGRLNRCNVLSDGQIPCQGNKIPRIVMPGLFRGHVKHVNVLFTEVGSLG